MAKPFDATLNSLIDARPEDWVSFLAPRLGLTPGPAEVLDTDLSATVQADKVFRLIGPPASLIQLELEANPRRGHSRPHPPVSLSGGAGANAGRKLSDTEWLGQVVIGTRVECGHLVVLIDTR